MSMPNIPDVCPKICINREDAINLLLASIAFEEFGLADLIEVESKKIKYVLGEDDYDEYSAKDILNVNKSVNNTIKDIIKLQMLLQFKLENVMELTGSSSCITTCSSTTTSSTTTTCRTTTACSTSKHSTTSKPCGFADCPVKKENIIKKEHILCGTGHGVVLNVRDPFFSGIASLKPYVTSEKETGSYSSISYVVKKNNMLETINAFPDTIKLDVIKDDNLLIVIKGVGSIEKKDNSQIGITGRGSFELKVWESDMGIGCEGFQMIISSPNIPLLNHDSGKVKLSGFDLSIEHH